MRVVSRTQDRAVGVCRLVPPLGRRELAGGVDHAADELGGVVATPSWIAPVLLRRWLATPISDRTVDQRMPRGIKTSRAADSLVAISPVVSV
jgi:hypothetical protein